ncbi:MAG: hypothetical protein QNJ46_07990 [Leptolyngbyaceae cyanobacterium MO_188.B28]|nr:hypothetical protein [Leptolyngbyaceae cyanobacterium MO_188.B28]
MTQENRLDRIEASLERTETISNQNAETMRQMLQWQQNEAQQWRAGIDDTIRLTAQGIAEIGEKIDRLIEALTGIANRN